MARFSDNARGALLMMLSMAAFTFGDVVIKLASAMLPLGEIILIRGLFACLGLIGLAIVMGQWRFRFGRLDWVLVGVRSASELGATFLFLTALLQMPIANVAAIMQMLPLAITIGSALFYGEKVGWRRWLAIIVGLCGVLLIVRPGATSFNSYSLFVVGAVVMIAVRDLVTRRMTSSVPSVVTAFCTALAVMIFGGVLTVQGTWTPVTPTAFSLVVAAAALIIAGYLFSIQVMHVGEISFVSPFRYTSLLWALILGVLLFGEWPDFWTLVGAVIVVVTGIYMLIREARLAKLSP